jgi:hypothetical protein
MKQTKQQRLAWLTNELIAWGIKEAFQPQGKTDDTKIAARSNLRLFILHGNGILLPQTSMSTIQERVDFYLSEHGKWVGKPISHRVLGKGVVSYFKPLRQRVPVSGTGRVRRVDGKQVELLPGRDLHPFEAVIEFPKPVGQRTFNLGTIAL